MRQPASAASSVAVEVSLVVHVIGAVARPGLVSVPAGSRVADVVTAAGGSTAEAAVDRLNLAAPVSDGMQVRVPTIDDDSEVPLMTAAPPPATSGSDPGAPGAGVESGPVNLNTASTEQLDTLPGIGPATAAAIIRWREDNGGFHLLEDLLAVPGIGPAKMAAIRDLVTV
jgi:competence protein ComEA